tara:strand:- start:1 stop:231 length:231 start_codon:yes stop_codon:yes gene_type:complete
MFLLIIIYLLNKCDQNMEGLNNDVSCFTLIEMGANAHSNNGELIHNMYDYCINDCARKKKNPDARVPHYCYNNDDY